MADRGRRSQREAWRGAQAAVMECGHSMLRLGDDIHVVEVLGCSAAEERGRCGGRNGRRGAAKLGLGAAPIMEEREWGSGWWPRRGKDGCGVRWVRVVQHTLGQRRP
jgi:hypothetical protein